VIIIKTDSQIAGIRASSKLAAATLRQVLAQVKSGVNTQILNDLAHQFIISHQATPAPLNYSGFPKSICTSINNVVCHGIPSIKDVLKDGDIINIDLTTILNGYYGDVSASVAVGKVSAQASKLLEVTKKSLDIAIASIKPGKTINESIGQVIENYVTQFGFTPVRDLGGHGVGLNFHEDPFIYHYFTPDNNIILKEGMIFTVEPMINASNNWRVTFDKNDGWTVRTSDGSLSAQFEHTILVTPTGAEILTQ